MIFAAAYDCHFHDLGSAIQLISLCLLTRRALRFTVTALLIRGIAYVYVVGKIRLGGVQPPELHNNLDI